MPPSAAWVDPWARETRKIDLTPFSLSQCKYKPENDDAHD